MTNFDLVIDLLEKYLPKTLKGGSIKVYDSSESLISFLGRVNDSVPSNGKLYLGFQLLFIVDCRDGMQPNSLLTILWQYSGQDLACHTDVDGCSTK